jgi:hypothetical protein
VSTFFSADFISLGISINKTIFYPVHSTYCVSLFATCRNSNIIPVDATNDFTLKPTQFLSYSLPFLLSVDSTDFSSITSSDYSPISHPYRSPKFPANRTPIKFAYKYPKFTTKCSSINPTDRLSIFSSNYTTFTFTDEPSD